MCVYVLSSWTKMSKKPKQLQTIKMTSIENHCKIISGQDLDSYIIQKKKSTFTLSVILPVSIFDIRNLNISGCLL